VSRKKGISYTLCPESLSVTGNPGGGAKKIEYVEHQDVRRAAMDLIDAVSSGYAKEIFARVCGCCGQCCRNRRVLLNAREIAAISTHLGISEALCREKYLVPAATWSDRDGILAARDEECIFLEQGTSGTYKCAIFEVRPLSCREIKPDMECCRKDAGKLIALVEKIEIEPHSIECHLTSGSRFRIDQRSPELQDAVDMLHHAVSPCLDSTESELSLMTRDAHGVLDWLLINYMAGVSMEILMPRLQAMKAVVDDFDTLTPLRQKNPGDLELLWSKVRNLTGMFASGRGCGNGSEGQEADGKTCTSVEEEHITLCFQPTALSVEMRQRGAPVVETLHYEHHGHLMSLVRRFMEALVTSGEPGLVDVLGHDDPYCFQCGVCCGSYDLEIMAVDIERIADYLHISEGEVREKYIEPGRRSWNRRDGLIRKVEIGDKEERCVFLEVTNPTESKCRIYSARSKLCRDYPPNTRLCRKKSLLLKGHEHLGNILSCQVAGGTVHITTLYTSSHTTGPFAMYLKDHEELREAFRQVRREVLQILGKQREEPGKHW